MTIQWWCSARGTPWTWQWQAYPGVWLLVAVMAWGVFRVADATTLRRVAGIAGVILLWLALDWPLGAIGIGYLASAHALQFILLALVVPPLLLVAVPPRRAHGALERHPALAVVVRKITQPVVAAIAFNIVMAVTHVPDVVDRLMRAQAGAFVLDVAWLLAGIVFWWPVVLHVPERPHFAAPVRMLFVFLGTQGHLLLAMWLLSAAFPVYATYELAPRITALSAMTDQQIAGGLMIVAAEPIIYGLITLIFYRWFAATERGGAMAVDGVRL